MLPHLPRLDRRSSRPLFGLSVSYPSSGILERVGPDWDWLWIDGQHGELTLGDAIDLVRATDLIGRPGLVRVPSHDPSWIGKVLDAGAAGVIVPMVETLAEARTMVQAAKFPPMGNRSFGGLRVATRAGRDYYKTANQDTVLILQVESNEAVALADQLAAIEGVDGLFLGPDDLVIRSGQEVAAPKNQETIGRQCRTVADACQRHQKLNVGIALSEATLQMAKEYRWSLVVGGGDFALLTNGSQTAADKVKKFFEA